MICKRQEQQHNNQTHLQPLLELGVLFVNAAIHSDHKAATNRGGIGARQQRSASRGDERCSARADRFNCSLCLHAAQCTWRCVISASQMTAPKLISWQCAVVQL